MRRISIAVLLVGLLAVWLLTSSIKSLTFSPGSGRIDSAASQATGGSGGGGFSLPLLPELPPFALNVTLPQPPINITLLIPRVGFWLPAFFPFNFSLGLGFGGWGLGFGEWGIGVGWQGGMGQSGQVGVATAPTGGAQVAGGGEIPVVNLSPLALLLAVFLAAALLAAKSGVLRYLRRGQASGERAETILRQVETPPRVMASGAQGEVAAVWRPVEKVVPFRGWGGSELFSTPVAPDLPFIWEYNAPLPVVPREGVVVKISEPARLMDGGILMPEPGCYKLDATAPPREESHLVRAVDYAAEVVRLFRLNAGALAGDTPYTAREVIKRLKEEGSVAEGEDAAEVVKVFEEVRYGQRRPSRETFERFLRSLARCFKEAKIYSC